MHLTLAAGNSSDPSVAIGLIVVGLFLLAGFAAHMLGRRIHLPRVTLLLLLGFLVGPSVLGFVPREAEEWFPLAANVALSVIGFQLGERFLGKKLRQTGRTVLLVSLTEVVFAAACVFVAVMLVGVPLPLALLLASVAPASDPASTLDVIREAEAKGPVTDTILGVVAIDDAWGVILFSVLVVVAQVVGGGDGSATTVVHGFVEVGGGLLLGAGLGLPMALLTGRIRPGELTLVETLGFVLLCSGLATWWGLSHILACMAMGAVVSNVARHHKRPFHAIEEVEQPLLIVFFVLAGFHFDIGQVGAEGGDQLWQFVLLGGGYILGRAVGLLLGGYGGAALAGAPTAVRTHTGWCLLPQAGVALGLALLVSQKYPEFGSRVLTIVVATTIIFEILGPVITRLALKHAGEITD